MVLPNLQPMRHVVLQQKLQHTLDWVMLASNRWCISRHAHTMLKHSNTACCDVDNAPNQHLQRYNLILLQVAYAVVKLDMQLVCLHRIVQPK